MSTANHEAQPCRLTVFDEASHRVGAVDLPVHPRTGDMVWIEGRRWTLIALEASAFGAAAAIGQDSTPIGGV